MDELLGVIKAEVEAREASEGNKVNKLGRPQQLLKHKTTSGHPFPTHPTMGAFSQTLRHIPQNLRNSDVSIAMETTISVFSCERV